MGWFALTNGLVTVQCSIRAHQLVKTDTQRKHVGAAILFFSVFGSILGVLFALPIVYSLPVNWKL